MPKVEHELSIGDPFTLVCELYRCGNSVLFPIEVNDGIVLGCGLVALHIAITAVIKGGCCVNK